MGKHDDKVVASITDALAPLKDGMTILCGGFGLNFRCPNSPRNEARQKGTQGGKEKARTLVNERRNLVGRENGLAVEEDDVTPNSERWLVQR